jgi:hypothetical protein
MGIARGGIAGRAALYCAAIATVFGIAATVVAMLQPDTPNPIGFGRARTAYYQADAHRFDMVFLGDSRTYCGIHADLIDPLTGRRSINLSAFAHWLPTQYAQLRDIAGDIAPGTVVVLSVGHQNFDPSPIQRSYPISLANAMRLVAMGVSPMALADNVAWAHRPQRLTAERGALRDRVLALAGLRDAPAPIAAIPGQANIAAVPDALAAQAATLLGEWRGKPGVADAQVTIDEGKVTSVAIIRTGGSYYRVETDPAYFRARQIPAKTDPTSFAWMPDPVRLRIFEAMLDLLRERGIATIVNEMEEAPHVYGGDAMRAKFRDAMDRHIRPLAVARGFPYTRVDFDRLNDDDYFDYNHLNSRGIERFTPMLAEKLRGQL